MEFDIEDVDKGVLSFLSGLGIIAILLFFYFFMKPEAYSELYNLAFFIILVAAMMVVFYLLEDISFMYNKTLSQDDPEAYRNNVKRGSNFISGMLLMLMIGMNIITYADYSDFGGHSYSAGIRITIIAMLATASVYLVVYSMFMGSD